jgi:hypothetical protein
MLLSVFFVRKSGDFERNLRHYATIGDHSAHHCRVECLEYANAECSAANSSEFKYSPATLVLRMQDCREGCGRGGPLSRTSQQVTIGC